MKPNNFHFNHFENSCDNLLNLINPYRNVCYVQENCYYTKQLSSCKKFKYAMQAF